MNAMDVFSGFNGKYPLSRFHVTLILCLLQGPFQRERHHLQQHKEGKHKRIDLREPWSQLARDSFLGHPFAENVVVLDGAHRSGSEADVR